MRNDRPDRPAPTARAMGHYLPWKQPCERDRIQQSPKGRLCACGTKLSIYNHEHRCSACEGKP